MSAYLVIVVGPTAVGKTDFCVKLAKEFGADVISCDSRQLYKEMSIGTAKPTLKEMDGVKHHFVNSHSVADLYSAGDFERDVDILLDEYFRNNSLAIMSGGTGLFVRAVTHGLDEMPQAPAELRAKLMERLEQEGFEVLREELQDLDPHGFGEMDNLNPQRVVRALEICISTGKPFSSFKSDKEKEHPYAILKIGLERPREELYERINRRVDQMLENGLVEEVKLLRPFKDANALQTVGYKEVFGYLDGEYDFLAMTELLKRNTRRYAKRQLTWFKNQDDFVWFHPDDFKEVLQHIQQRISLP